MRGPAHARARPAARPPAAVLTASPRAAAARDSAADAVRKSRLITAIKTPYLPNGKIDLDAYDELVRRQCAAGVDGLVVGGTTGEGQLMSWDEHVMLIAHTVNSFGDKILVIGNTGSNATREALHATEQGFAVGMAAALQINPYYGRTSHTGLATHFKAVLDEGPGMLYNVPGRTGQDIPDDVVLALRDHPAFLGVKECTGNARIAAYAAAGVRCWTGNDDEAHAARHGAGAAGVVSVTSNLVPAAFASLMDTQNDEAAAALAPLIDWLFCEPNPIAVNTALAMCGLCAPVFRLPYVPLSRAQREEGARLLKAAAPYLAGGVDPDAVRVLDDDDFVLVSRY